MHQNYYRYRRNNNVKLQILSHYPHFILLFFYLSIVYYYKLLSLTRLDTLSYFTVSFNLKCVKKVYYYLFHREFILFSIHIWFFKTIVKFVLCKLYPLWKKKKQVLFNTNGFIQILTLKIIQRRVLILYFLKKYSFTLLLLF